MDPRVQLGADAFSGEDDAHAAPPEEEFPDFGDELDAFDQAVEDDPWSLLASKQAACDAAGEFETERDREDCRREAASGFGPENPIALGLARRLLRSAPRLWREFRRLGLPRELTDPARLSEELYRLHWSRRHTSRLRLTVRRRQPLGCRGRPKGAVSVLDTPRRGYSRRSRRRRRRTRARRSGRA